MKPFVVKLFWPLRKIFPYPIEFTQFSPRFHHIGLNIKAFRETRMLLRKKPKVLGIFGLPRGGTNMITALLHYHPKLFAFSERIQDWENVHYRMFIAMSTFKDWGLQEKDIRDVDYLIYNKLGWDGNKNWQEGTLLRSGNFKFIYYLRNPLRVIISRHSFAKKHDRKEWLYNKSSFKTVIEETKDILLRYQKMQKKFPQKVLLVLHEQLCARPDDNLRKIFTFIDPPLSFRMAELGPKTFFTKSYCCNAEIVQKSDHLQCGRCRRIVEGYGSFNPLSSISLDRAMREPLEAFFHAQDLDYAKKEFGDKILDYWYLDSKHRYEEEFPLEDLPTGNKN